MKVTWLGHSCFRIEEQGFTVILDPYTKGSVPGYRPLKEEADLVICSHSHSDHCAANEITMKHGAKNPFRTDFIDTWHDDAKGAKRGANRITILTSGDLKLVHMGDIGCELTDEQYEKLAGADVLMIPVGGYFTLEPPEIKKMADRINAVVTIPMHYRGMTFGYDVIGDLNAYTDLCDDIQLVGQTMEIKKGLQKQTAVMVPVYAV